MFGPGPIEVLILIALAIGAVALLKHIGGRNVFMGVAGTVGLGLAVLVLMLFFWVSHGERVYQEAVSVSAGDDHVSYSRTIGPIPANPAPTVAASTVVVSSRLPDTST